MIYRELGRKNVKKVKFFSRIGKNVINLCRSLGKIICFLAEVIKQGIKPPYYWKEMLFHNINFGFYSIPVIGLTSFFTGAVLALQSYTGFSRFSAQNSLPMLVVLCITRELGPVIAGLMFAGRVGATITSEISTMAVTQQIDALSTLSTNSSKYLYFPRIVAGIITMPILTLLADIIGVMGGWLIAVYQLGFSSSHYLKMTMQYFVAEDVISGLIKSTFFGLSTTLLGCFWGAKSNGGAAGVGRATMNAVVASSISILLLDYLLTTLLFHK